MDQDRSRLPVPQQAVRIREVGPEGDVAGFVIEVGFDRSDLARLGKLLAIGQHELQLQLVFVLRQFRLVLQVPGFRHVEVDPHDAVVRERREHLPFLNQTAVLVVQAVNDAIKGSAMIVKFSSAPASFALAWALASLA